MRLLEKHWKTALAVAIVLAVYFYVTRKRVIGTVDDTGAGMTINGVPS